MHKTIKRKTKIDISILQKEIKGKIREFYPFLLGFYFLSLFISLFSEVWSSFFYWPAFHLSVGLFTLLFILTFEFDLSWKEIPKTNKKSKNLLSKPSLKNSTKRIKWIIFTVRNRTNLTHHSIRFIFLSKEISLRVFYKIWTNLYLMNNSFQKVNVQFRKYCIEVYKKILTITPRTWLKVIFITFVLIFALFQEIIIFDFLVLFYVLASILFILNSRYAVFLAAIFFIVSPVLLYSKQVILAESSSVYAFYFLVIAVLTQMREEQRK